MAYVRFSSELHSKTWKTSDIYCWADVNGKFITLVASYKFVREPSLIPTKFIKNHKLVSSGHPLFNQYLRWEEKENKKYKPLKSPYAGEKFEDNTERAMYGRVLWLHSTGLSIPKDFLKICLKKAVDIK